MLKIVETFGRSGLGPGPAGGSDTAPPDPLAGGEGVAVPQEPKPALSLRSRPPKSWARPCVT